MATSCPAWVMPEIVSSGPSDAALVLRELIVPWFLDRPRPGLDRVAGVPSPLRGPVSTVKAMPTAELPLHAVAPVHAEIAAFTSATISDGDLPLITAGDCCAAIPVAAGVARAGIAPVLVWLDAHGDFNTHATSASGFLGGMPLAMLTGRGDQSMLQSCALEPVVDTRVYLGDARDLDTAEAAALQRSGVHQVRRLEQILSRLPPGAQVHLHFDCDVISSDEVPAQSYPVPGGPGADDVTAFMTSLAAHTEIVAISVCAWEPALDERDDSARLCRRSIDAACGLSVALS